MILLHTIARRWYAFAFIAGFFWAATTERDWRKALRFLVVASVVAWCGEYLSTHSVFPYGRYDYVAPTHGKELYVANVPLFVPVSFAVPVWAGRALANVGMRSNSPGRLIIGGALCAAAIDLVMDPMTLRGRSWFLGPVYLYQANRGWFNVPWSNFAGWILVGAIILWIDELFEAGNERSLDPIRGPTLAAGICLFFIVIALATAHWSIAFAGIGVTAGLLAVTGRRIPELMTAAGGTTS